MRRLVYALPLLAFLAIAAWFAVGLTRDPQVVPSALLDQPVPDFTLPALAGMPTPGLTDEAIAGRVALVNVFASWCGPCRVEHPQFMRLQREGRVALYGIAYKDRAADAREFLRQLGNPYAAIGHDESGRVAIEWGVYGVPETFVIDRQGRIRLRHVGAVTPDVLERTILPLIARLERN
jgi:cytochrome c biogenesis protein CcmG/thiol:disulfide interchange protein DsbE